MKVRMILMIVIVVLVFGGIFAWRAYEGRRAMLMMRSHPMPPAPVTVSRVREEQWSPHLSAVGSLKAVQGVNVTAQSGGLIVGIQFRSGMPVRQGAVLVRLNDNTQRAQLAVDRAQAALARVNLSRDEGLYRLHEVSRAQLDTDRANEKSAAAKVAQDQAVLANLNVVAPFGGRLGIRQVDMGQYIAPGTEIVTLQTDNPLYVEFSLPQNELGSLRVGDRIHVSVDAFKNSIFSGKIDAISSAVDPQTRNIAVQGIVANPGHKLTPGMFGDVEVVLPQRRKVLAIPALAISYNTYGDYVFVVEKKTVHGHAVLTVVERSVEVGTQQGPDVEVLRGLKAGEEVVTSGQLNVHPGMPITVVRAAA